MKVVVGIDTSPAAAEALRWAARYARAVGADLHAVHAYVGPPKAAVPLPTDPTVCNPAGPGRLLVGSVSHQCLTHAKCPVVAVPAPHLIEEAGLNDYHASS